MARKVQVKDVYSGRRGFLTDTEYNREMEEWARATQKLSKAQAALFTKGKRRNHTYKSGKKAGKTEGKLRNHVQFQMKSDSGEVAGQERKLLDIVAEHEGDKVIHLFAGIKK